MNGRYCLDMQRIDWLDYPWAYFRIWVHAGSSCGPWLTRRRLPGLPPLAFPTVANDMKLLPYKATEVVGLEVHGADSRIKPWRPSGSRPATA